MHPKYEKMIDAMKKLNQETSSILELKAQDYSSDNLLQGGKKGIVTRMLDKIYRLNNLVENDFTPNNESIHDTIVDIINYSHIFNAYEGLQPRFGVAYLAGPIDDVSRQEATAWRDKARIELEQMGVASYDPTAPFSGKMPSNVVRQINDQAILGSDVIIANLSGEGRAFGTIREIEFAKSHNIPVLIVGKLESLYAFDCKVFASFEDLYSHMQLFTNV